MVRATAISGRHQNTRKMMASSRSMSRGELIGSCVVIGAIVVVAGYSAVSSALSSSTGPTAFTVLTLPNGDTAVTIVSTKATNAQMSRQLKHMHVAATVESQVVDPSRAGHWVAAEAPDLTVSTALVGQVATYPTTVDVPTGAGATLILGRTTTDTSGS